MFDFILGRPAKKYPAYLGYTVYQSEYDKKVEECEALKLHAQYLEASNEALRVRVQQLEEREHALVTQLADARIALEVKRARRKKPDIFDARVLEKNFGEKEEGTA